jgi:hypothetical protein
VGYHNSITMANSQVSGQDLDRPRGGEEKTLRAMRTGTGERILAARKSYTRKAKEAASPCGLFRLRADFIPGPPISEALPRAADGAPKPPISARLEPPLRAAAGRGISGELFDHVYNFGSLPRRKPDEGLEQPQALDRLAGWIAKLLAQLGNRYVIFHLTPLSSTFERACAVESMPRNNPASKRTTLVSADGSA